ncbi:S-layer family protein [Cyanobacteria bacterium FACHB-502]|nr:S-layer family protein [Cyanobacteria bacterium FACHB-502]
MVIKRFRLLHLRSLQSATGVILLGLGWMNQAQAQITPDATLPNASQVTRDGNRHVITGGTQSGRNLFHSFRNFSVPNQNTASFRQIDPGIENIFSRVTGASASRINGTIEAHNRDGSLSRASLFLINPNGILFGPDASLNIGGSFIATTANSIQFDDGTQFSAVNPQANPLLTVSVPVGIQFGRSPGRIVNRSEVDFNTNAPLLDSADNSLPAPFNDSSINPFEGLRVASNQTIALLGGNVQFPGGELTAPGGHIEVSSMGGAGLVRLIQMDQGWRFNYSNQQQFGNIRLVNTDLDVSGDRAGSIQILGDRIYIANPDGGGVRAYTYSQNSGSINIQGTHLIVEDDGFISAETYGSGQGGNIQITTNQLTVEDALITTGTLSSGQGGNIQVTTNRLLINDGGQIAANTYANGQGGDVVVRASDSVEIRDASRQQNGQPELNSNKEPFPSGVIARVACLPEQGCSQVTGQGGNILIETDNLRLLDGGQISADTYATGSAGSITVRASNIEIIGTVLNANGSSVTNGGRTAPSSLSTITQASGNAGRIEVATNRLSVRDGATLQSSTLGAGNAGNLRVEATESIELIGVGAGTEVPAGLFSFSGGIPETAFELNRNATGRAGNLRVAARSIIMRDSAVIAVGSANPNLDRQGRAGNLLITADQLQAADQARLLANTNSGRGGDLNLRIADLLLLSQNSQISTTAGSERRGGNGGNIALNSGFLIAAPNTNADITANAFTGNGGEIRINAAGVLGLTATDTLTPDSNPQNDITASSALGVNGEIRINGLRTDPTRGLQLPEAPVNEPLLAQSCLPVTNAASGRSSFVASGRGGLPPSPYNFLSSDDLWQDWRLTAVEPEAASDRSAAVFSPAPAPSGSTVDIVEAQGWIRNAAGQIELVAQVSVPSSVSSTLSLLNCSPLSHASQTRLGETP